MKAGISGPITAGLKETDDGYWILEAGNSILETRYLKQDNQIKNLTMRGQNTKIDVERILFELVNFGILGASNFRHLSYERTIAFIGRHIF